MHDLDTPFVDLQQSMAALEQRLREIAEQEVEDETRANPHVPWAQNGDSPKSAEIKHKLRALEIERHAYAKACILSGAGESLAVLFQERIEQMAHDLGPLAEWDGSETSLILFLEASTPDHDTGDARGKRQFVRETVHTLRQAGVGTSEIAEIAARRSMRPRLAAAVNSITKDESLSDDERRERVQQAALDARTETARTFDETWKARRVEMLVFDESELLPRKLWRRVYLLSGAQRDMIGSMLRGREMQAPMPLEHAPTLNKARACVESGDYRNLYLALMPEVAREIAETLDMWGGCDLETLKGAALSDASMGTVESAIALLIEYGIIEETDNGYQIADAKE